MSDQPERDPEVAQAIGFLVMAAGRVEANLAIAFILIAYGEATRNGLQKVSGMHTGALLDEFKRLDVELPDGLQVLLDELRGPDGLATRRDQIIHAIWLWAEDGTVRGANLRKSLFRLNGPEPVPFGIDEINAVTEGLDRVSERLGAWVFRKVVVEPRPEGV